MKHFSKKWLVVVLVLVCALCVVLAACNKDSGDPTPLDAPVISIDNGVLSWEAVDHAASYNIYCNDEWEANVESSPYTIPTKAVGTYYYTVSAVSGDSAYTNSVASEAVTHTVSSSGGSTGGGQTGGDGPTGDGPTGGPTQATKLDAPTDVTITGNVLSWTAVDHADGYDVYVNGVKENTSSVTETSYTIAKKSASGEYRYTVIATSTSSDYSSSDASSAASFVVTKLTKPSVTLHEVQMGRDDEDVDAGDEADPDPDDGDEDDEEEDAVSYQLWWTAVTGADSYDVYLDGSFVANISNDPYEVETGIFRIRYIIPVDELGYGTYSYTVVAIPAETDFVHVNSDASTATVLEYKDPNAGKLGIPVLSADGVTISWVEIPNADSYWIYENGVHIATVTESSYSNGEGQLVYTYKADPQGQSVNGQFKYQVQAITSDPAYKNSDLQSDDTSNSGANDKTIRLIPMSWPSISIDGRVISWNALTVPNADAFDLYCNGVYEATVNIAQYTIPEKTAGIYTYYVVARDTTGQYVKSDNSNKVNYFIYDDLTVDGPAQTIAMSTSGDLTIYIDESVPLRQWYEVEVIVIDYTLNDGQTSLTLPWMNIWGRTGIMEDGTDTDCYRNRVTASGSGIGATYSAVLVPIESLIRLQIGETNGTIIFTIQLKSSSKTDTPIIPEEEHEFSIEGKLGYYEEAGEDYYSVTVNWLFGNDPQRVDFDSTVLPGATYKFVFYVTDKNGEPVNLASKFAYQWDDDAFFGSKTYGQSLGDGKYSCEITIPSNQNYFYIVHTIYGEEVAKIQLALTELIDEGSFGGGDEDYVLSVGDTITVNILGSTGYVDIQLDGVEPGDYRLSLTGSLDCDITVYVGAATFTLYKADRWIGTITIGDDDETIRLELVDDFNNYEGIAVTLSEISQDGDTDELTVDEDAKNFTVVGGAAQTEALAIHLVGVVSGEKYKLTITDVAGNRSSDIENLFFYGSTSEWQSWDATVVRNFTSEDATTWSKEIRIVDNYIYFWCGYNVSTDVILSIKIESIDSTAKDPTKLYADGTPLAVTTTANNPNVSVSLGDSYTGDYIITIVAAEEEFPANLRASFNYPYYVYLTSDNAYSSEISLSAPETLAFTFMANYSPLSEPFTFYIILTPTDGKLYENVPFEVSTDGTSPSISINLGSEFDGSYTISIVGSDLPDGLSVSYSYLGSMNSSNNYSMTVTLYSDMSAISFNAMVNYSPAVLNFKILIKKA